MGNCKNTVYINNGQVNKRVPLEELEGYLILGWVKGMKPRSSESIAAANEKRKQTCLSKYGVENVHQLTAVKEKVKATCLEIYGVDNPAKATKVKQKAKETNTKLWPDKTNYHNLKQARQTLLERFHSMDNFYKWRYENMDWEQTIKKQIQTKRDHNTFNYSQPEEDLYKELCAQYGADDVIRNYKEERYPFYCDFYIKSKDLFIELNRHWTHGGHFFNPEDENDLQQLSIWQEKAKTSQYMEYAIINWTIRDPLKKRIAEENKINYQVIW